MMSATEGCDEESRQHRVTGHSPNPGAAAGRKGFPPAASDSCRTSTIESETLAIAGPNLQSVSRLRAHACPFQMNVSSRAFTVFPCE